MLNSNLSIVPMGTITGAFGVLGWVKIKSDSDSPENLTKFDSILIQIDDIWKEYKLIESFSKENFLYVKLDKVSDRDIAMSLKGLTIGVLRDKLPKLADNEYYQFDLIGFSVFNKNDQLGTVEKFMMNGANSIMVIKIKNDLKELLIPFVNKFIIDVNLQNKSILVDWEISY